MNIEWTEEEKYGNGLVDPIPFGSRECSVEMLFEVYNHCSYMALGSEAREHDKRHECLTARIKAMEAALGEEKVKEIYKQCGY